MKRYVLTLIALLTLTACTTPAVVTRPQEPVPVHVPLACTQACPPLPPWQADQPDGSAPWDTLGAQQPEIAAAYAQCDAARRACAAVLQRLEQVGVIITTINSPGRGNARARDSP